MFLKMHVGSTDDLIVMHDLFLSYLIYIIIIQCGQNDL